jgi:hypothetical protein
VQIRECTNSYVGGKNLPSIEEFCLGHRPSPDWKLVVEPRVVLDQLNMFTMADSYSVELSVFS